jgi:hypothetical protein
MTSPYRHLPSSGRADFSGARRELGGLQSHPGKILQEIDPKSGIERLWAADLVELSWDIVRYRALRQKMLKLRRQDAIAATATPRPAVYPACIQAIGPGTDPSICGAMSNRSDSDRRN